MVTHQCAPCDSEKLVKNGHACKGTQKYPCTTCGCYGPLGAQRGHGETRRAQAKRAVPERSSLRGLERNLGISRRPLARWMENWATPLPPLTATRLRRSTTMCWNWMNRGRLGGHDERS